MVSLFEGGKGEGYNLKLSSHSLFPALKSRLSDTM